MDTKLKEALEAKNCPMIYAANEDDGLEISFRGSMAEIMSLVGALMLSISNETGIPIDSLLVTMISKSTEALKELEEEHEEERKVGMN